MSSEAITDADRERLQRVLERNREHGDRVKEGFRQSAKTYEDTLRESDDFEAVQEAIAELADEGRSCISPREVAERIDLAPSRVGQAMSLLGDDGELTLVSRTNPKTWRIER